MQQALEAAVGELVLGPALDPSDAAAVEAFLARHGVAAGDAAALRAGELERLLVYRELVRGTLREALELSIPRSIARLGASFTHYFEDFLARRGSSSHYLRDVTGEFLAFCAETWPNDARVPGYLLDLARHEALHIEIAAAARDPLRQVAPALDLDAPLEFVRAVRRMHYAYAVHRLPEALEDRSEPERLGTDLLVYRSPDHEVRYLELSPLAAAILDRLLSGATLRDSVGGAAAAHGAGLEPALLEGTARLLADLSERGVLLGAAASPAPPPKRPFAHDRPDGGGEVSRRASDRQRRLRSRLPRAAHDLEQAGRDQVLQRPVVGTHRAARAAASGVHSGRRVAHRAVERNRRHRPGT
jgi:hypothetical protein